MIMNEKQYRISKTALARMKQSLEHLQAKTARADGSSVHPRLRKAHIDAVRSEIEVLHTQIEEYERLKNEGSSLDIELVEELPRQLIRARIAAGLTHRELAEKLGVKEQQVQRYEATEYSTASLRRVREVASVLASRKSPKIKPRQKSAVV